MSAFCPVSTSSIALQINHKTLQNTSMSARINFLLSLSHLPDFIPHELQDDLLPSRLYGKCLHKHKAPGSLQYEEKEPFRLF